MNYKQFNLELAKAGAPVGLTHGNKVRIICFDLKSDDNFSIVALSTLNGGWEAICTFDNEGIGYGRKLVMLPLGYVEGKPVFVGDVLIDPDGYKEEIGVHSIKLSETDRFKGFRWPKIFTREVWQPRFKKERGGEYIHWSHFSSKEVCEKEWKSHSAFIRAELISTYEVSE